MAPFKSLNPNGMHAGFYQHMWDVVSDTICMFALDFFASGTLPMYINDILFTLIFKVQNPKLISQLRRTSLCNVGYKIITKTIANRLKDIMA